MKDISKNKLRIRELENSGIDSFQTSNPLSALNNINNIALTDYTQTISRPKYDTDTMSVIETTKFLNNLAPKFMPQYNFNINEINGEPYYRPDGTLLLIREWDSDVIRDYYASPNGETVFFKYWNTIKKLED